ncbi:hypothetical protein KIN20_036886 [Parelaphostrongylus tenuis]|uniref:Uncharacterized protein n=1 Tax=Parelaphostrongylus tenuis TaxID=148309 RepID=A0AAD5WKS0_PARTN|nr:hypothetical protein KIN20_036886 [Parelaphostrongylus tenuis]
MWFDACRTSGNEPRRMHHCRRRGDGNMSVAVKMVCMPSNQQVKITPVSTNHTSISETLITTNIIMANWSKAMRESVVNRAVRMLASGPLRSHFFSAFATVSGN